MLEPDAEITCIDCGGRAFLLTPPREDDHPWVAGDIVAYRCEDCLDRWDLVLDDDELDAESGRGTDGGLPGSPI